MKLAFYHGPRAEWRWKLVSLLVRWRTRGRFDHVEMIFSDGRVATSSISKAGIAFQRKDHDPAHWEVIEVAGDEGAAWRWWRAHRDARFDAMGVLGFLIGFTRGDDDRWFCSEACAASLGFPDPWRFDPNTLHAAVQRKVLP